MTTPEPTDRRLALLAALTLAGSAAAALGLAITLAPARSGPNCLSADCVEYPYTDVAAFAPQDYWWMYPAAVLPVAFYAFVVAARRSAPPRRRYLAELVAGLALAALVVLTLTYGIQLMAVQPSLLKGESEYLSLWSQYNPHGLFIATESLGYLLFCLALLGLAGVVPGVDGFARGLRWTSGGLGGLGVLALPLLAGRLGTNLEYHYEVASLLCAWLASIVLGILAAVLAFRGGDRAG